MNTQFIRPQAAELVRRLREPRRFILSISGARQVGKTTLALQVAERSKLPCHFASAAASPMLMPAIWARGSTGDALRLRHVAPTMRAHESPARQRPSRLHPTRQTRAHRRGQF